MQPTWRDFEQLILEEIFERTGYKYYKLNEVEVATPELLELILPLLTAWVPRLPEPHYRGAIYFLLGKLQHLCTLFDRLLEWWISETGKAEQAQLTRMIAHCTKRSNADRVWNLIRHASYPSQSALLIKLAKFPHLHDEVLGRILADLRSRSFQPGDIYDYARFPDPNVQAWIISQADATEPELRTAARKVLQQRSRTPKGFYAVDHEPDRSRERYSAEVEIGGLDGLLATTCDNLGMQRPPRIGTQTAFLENANPEQWFVAKLASAENEVCELWLRAEDVDVAEVVITVRPSRSHESGS